QAMDGIKGGMRKLSKLIDAKDQAGAWKCVCEVQQHILEAKQESPEMTASKPEAERPAFVNAFHTQVSGLLKGSCGLRAVVLAAKWDDAMKQAKEMTGPMQKAGHEKFREREH